MASFYVLPLIYALLFVHTSCTLLPGLAYMSYGYNVLFGNPQSKGQADPGYRELIFDTTNMSNGQMLNGYEVPNGINAVDADSCDSDFQYQAITGSNAYLKGLQASVNIDGSGFSNIGFSLSTGFQKVYQQTTNTSKLYTSSFTQCSVYEASLNAPFALPAFTPNFASAIKEMPTEYQPYNEENRQFFYNFINLYFGTHYLLSIQLGGIYGAQYEMDSYSFSSFASSNLSLSASCNYAAQSTFDIAGMTDIEREEAKDFTSITTDQSVWYSGGTFPKNGTWQQWAKTLKNSSMPIIITLDEISNLLTAINFPDMTSTIVQKQKALEAAVKDYCNQVSMDPAYNKTQVIMCDGFPKDKPLPDVSIFGGSYPDNIYGIYNPYTSGINCEPGYEPYTWMKYNYDNDMKQHLCYNATQIKEGKRDAMMYFGGAYGYQNSPKEGCMYKNPMTDKCECPKGMNDTKVTVWIDTHTNKYEGVVCYNTSIKIGHTILGGFYQTGHLEVNNVYTKTTSCPAGYEAYQIAHFHCDGHTGEKGQTSDLWMCSNNVYKIQ